MNPTINDIARRMVAAPKGILAADESEKTMNKRLKAEGLPEDVETRRRYRELLLDTDGIQEYLSGIILQDETVRQTTSKGVNFVELVSGKGIVPGIKIDGGLMPDPESAEEEVSKGLEGLKERLAEYRAMGLAFTKWRAVTHIKGVELPTSGNIKRSNDVLIECARIVQEAGMVPILEPEVLIDGDHSIDRAEEVTQAVLSDLFARLPGGGADLSGVVLKTSMVLSGKAASNRAKSSEVAEKTAKVLHAAVPPSVPGVVFLSGGQTPIEATDNLNEIGKIGGYPWAVTFSYSRAIQEPVLSFWKNLDANVSQARKIFLHRLKMNNLARMGAYLPQHEKELA